MGRYERGLQSRLSQRSRNCSRTLYNDRPYNRVDHGGPVLSIQKFLHRAGGALTAIPDRVNRRRGTLWVYCIARSAVSRIVSVRNFGQSAKSLFVPKLMLRESPDPRRRWRIIKSLPRRTQRFFLHPRARLFHQAGVRSRLQMSRAYRVPIIRPRERKEHISFTLLARASLALARPRMRSPSS